MRKIAVLLVLLFTASCAPSCLVPNVPTESGYPSTCQEKMQASEHWQVLAKEIADRVKSVISPTDAIFISEDDKSTFGIAMRAFLATELQDRGMIATSDPNSPYILGWKTQEVIHQSDRNSSVAHAEEIISYALSKRDQYGRSSILRGTQIYYINYVDRGHYSEASLPVAILPEASLPKAVCPPVRYSIVNR